MERSFFLRLERVRLRLHFRRVLAGLRASSTPVGLSAVDRGRTIRDLEEYARTGRFPRHGGRGRPRPVFVDGAGTHCAVGHLLARNGEGALVGEVARTRNFARVRELAASPTVRVALRRLGLTPAEAARIQPAYYSPGPGPCHLVLLLQIVALACMIGPVLLHQGVLPGYHVRGRFGVMERPKHGARELRLAFAMGVVLSMLVFPALSPFMQGGGCGYVWDTQAWADGIMQYGSCPSCIGLIGPEP